MVGTGVGDATTDVVSFDCGFELAVDFSGVSVDLLSPT